jgi:hypothetical protein
VLCSVGSRDHASPLTLLPESPTLQGASPATPALSLSLVIFTIVPLGDGRVATVCACTSARACLRLSEEKEGGLGAPAAVAPAAAPAAPFASPRGGAGAPRAGAAANAERERVILSRRLALKRLLQDGVMVKKYGRAGFPHARFVWLSEDLH